MVYKKVANAFHYLNQNIWKWLAVLSTVYSDEY